MVRGGIPRPEPLLRDSQNQAQNRHDKLIQSDQLTNPQADKRLPKPMTLSTEERGRITARVPQTVQDTLQQAAELLGATLNQFVVQAALSEARRVIERDRVIHLSGTDAVFLMNLLEKPSAPNARLRKAFQTYKKRTLDAEHSTFNWTPRAKRVRERKRAA